MQYASFDKVQALCRRLRLPDEAVHRALRYIRDGSAAVAAPFFHGLFSPQTAADSAKAIETLFFDETGAPKDSAFGVMAVFLAAALRTREMYDEIGIHSSVYDDTMGFFLCVLNDNLATTGAPAFYGAAWWYHRQLSCQIFKLGVLEFEMTHLNEQNARICGMPEGEPVLSVHIPSGAVMTRDALDESYRMARKFFRTFYPGFNYRTFFCSTWLLAPALRGLLPAGSRILNFLSDYEILHSDEDNDGFAVRLFHTNEKITDYNLLPENTSLQRAAKKYLLQGGKIGWTTGVIRLEDSVWRH